MARPISVFILSDNRLLRESLGRILSKRGDLKIVSSQGFSENTCEEVARSAADVILLDSPDFVCSGVSGARTQKESRGLRMLLVAMEEDEQVFLRAIRAGAMGFIPKDASSLDVVAAVRSVARGEAVCPPRFCKFLFDCISSPLKTPLECQCEFSPYEARAATRSHDWPGINEQRDRAAVESFRANHQESCPSDSPEDRRG